MGKEVDEDREDSPEEIAVVEPKKIIKKYPFKTIKNNKKEAEDDDLKNWKPMKIA